MKELPHFEEAYLLNGDAEIRRRDWDSYDKAKRKNESRRIEREVYEKLFRQITSMERAHMEKYINSILRF